MLTNWYFHRQGFNILREKFWLSVGVADSAFSTWTVVKHNMLWIRVSHPASEDTGRFLDLFTGCGNMDIMIWRDFRKLSKISFKKIIFRSCNHDHTKKTAYSHHIDEERKHSYQYDELVGHKISLYGETDIVI